MRLCGVVQAMFKLTRQEQRIVAVMLGAVVLGTIVKEWRARKQEVVPAISVLTR